MSDTRFYTKWETDVKLNHLKAETQTMVNNAISDLKGALLPDSPKPGTDPKFIGKYELVGTGEFPNLIPIIHFSEDTPSNTPIVAESGFFNAVYWDGTIFTQLKVALPAVSNHIPEFVYGTTYTGPFQVIEDGAIYYLPASAGQTSERPSTSTKWIKISNSIADMDKKVDKVAGKGLSTNDYTNEDQLKVTKIKYDGDGSQFLGNDGLYHEVKGGGGGYFNITTEYPLSSGYYTLESATATLAGAPPDGLDPRGMIITFESAANVWSDYRFLGTGLNQLGDVSFWELVTVKNVVKSIKLLKGTQLEDLTPDENGNIDMFIPIVDVDETLSETGTNPVQGRAIYASIKQSVDNLGASLLLNTVSEGVYSLSLLNSDGVVLSTTETFSGGGTGPVAPTRVILNRITQNPTVKEGDPVKLSYFYDQVDTVTGESTGNGATAVITITRGATTNSYTQIIGAGTTNQIDVTEFLAVGTSNVRVRITTNDEAKQVSSISWTVNVIQLKLESSFNIATTITRTNNFNLPFIITGAGTKTVKLYVDGLPKDERVITSSSATGSFNIETDGLSHGTHSFQMVTVLQLPDGSEIRSNSIYLGVIIIEISQTAPVFATRFDYKDGIIIGVGQTPYIDATQYIDYTVVYALYDPQRPVAPAVVTVDGTVIQRANVSLVRNEVKSSTAKAATLPASLTSGATVYNFQVIAKKLDIDITEPTDNVTLKLFSTGKSNSDIDRDQWNYNGVTSKFENFTWSGNGWVNGALRLNGNAKTTVRFTPLSQSTAPNNSLAFLIKFKVSDLTDATAPVISCVDSSGTGFVITGRDARMVTRGNSEVTTKFASGEEYEIGFVSFPTADNASTSLEKQNSGMLYLYVNGIISGGVQRGGADDIYQVTPTNVVLGTNSKATLDVYAIRSYSRYLTHAEMLNVYLIDLNNVELLLKKYADNNILDTQGNISVQLLPKFLPYIVMTGKQENGVPTLLKAAIINNKSQKFDVDEILYIDPLNKSKNFKLTGGMIRLQGTSSLAYPVKNYGFYLYNSKGVQGTLVTGIEPDGTGGIPGPTPPMYSFKDATATQKAAAPVNCWTIKVDYAESSGSHNTGVARMVHEVLLSAGDKTPVQKKVSPSYNYDVRTTIDGFPIGLFYRGTVNDTPVFLSKGNFNNDKSTEAVFGFKDIPGYHDQAWVQNKFGGKNPTECWEFLNNDYPMGSYLDADFDVKDTDGKPRWMKVFEARFPDYSTINAEYEAGTRKPIYLERFVKWVNSTNNNDTKFFNELKDYVDVDYLCDYYVFTDVLGAVDQRVKNQMLAFWYDPDKDKMLGYFIFYDNDTILGVRNDGKLKYGWDIDENTIDPELSTGGRIVYAYAGHDSVLWKNLRARFADKISAAYVRLRARMSNEYMFKMFDDEESSKYVERVYNIDAGNKYVLPQTIGIETSSGNQKYNFLELMQGSRKSHRHWWLGNRLDLFDARFNTGNYRMIDLNWKGNSPVGATVKAVAARDYYISFVRESAPLKTEFVRKDQEFTYTYPQEANIGTIFHLYGGNWIKKVDLSGWGGFTSITIPRMQVLEEMILGGSGNTYTLPALTIGDALPLLKKLDITNYTALATLDLSGCRSIDSVIARGCSSLTSIKLADAAPIRTMVLPQNYSSLTLKGLPLLANNGITFENIGNITYLFVENSPNINASDILTRAINADPSKRRYVRFDTSVTDDGTTLRRWLNSNLGGITADGVITENTITIKGIYQLTAYMEDTEFAQMRIKFPELDLRQPAFSVIKFFTKDPVTGALIADPKNIQNTDNMTGYGTGRPYQVNGHALNILNKRHRFLGKQATKGVMTLCQLHDKDSTKFNDNVDPTLATSASLEGQMGDAWIKEPAYWYKAVTDFYGGAIHYAISSNVEMPPKPAETVTKKLTRAMIGAQVDGIRHGLFVRPGGVNINDTMGNDNRYSVVKVDVGGWKKIKCVVAPNQNNNNNLCTVFTQADGRIISEFKPDWQTYSQGSDIVLDIPVNAKYIYITLFKYYLTDVMGEWYFTVSNSTNPIDWETDWVRSEEKLFSFFETSYFNNKIRAVKTVQKPVMSVSTIDNALLARSMTFGDYEGLKNLKHLAMVKYGTTDIKQYTGIGNVQPDAQHGWGRTDVLGMQDTITNGQTLAAGYFGRDGSGATVFINTGVASALGYEGLIAGSTTTQVRDSFGGIVYIGSNETYWSLQWFNIGNDRKIILPNQSRENIWQGVPERWKGGKYFDLVPYNSRTTPNNNANQFTSSNTNFSFEFSNLSMRNVDWQNQEYTGPGSIELRNLDLRYTNFRLKFVGTSVETTNVEQFKNIIEAV